MLVCPSLIINKGRIVVDTDNPSLSTIPLETDLPFLHHYQGSIDFNTVNIHRTVWVYFLIFPRSRDGILSEMIFKDHIIQHTPCSLRSVMEISILGTVFSDTLPIENIRNTSSRRNIFYAPAMMQKYSV